VIAAAEDAVTICGGLGESWAPFVFAAHAQAEPGCSRRGSAAAAVGGRACSVPMPAGGDACLGTHACSAYTPGHQSLPASKPAPGPCLPLGTRSVAGILGAGILGAGIHHRAGIVRSRHSPLAGMITGRHPRVAGVSVWQASTALGGWVPGYRIR
jgi:hypothetical protein